MRVCSLNESIQERNVSARTQLRWAHLYCRARSTARQSTLGAFELKRRSFLSLLAAAPVIAAKPSNQIVEIPCDVLEDKLRGGFLGQVIGDLNGLKHEMK